MKNRRGIRTQLLYLLFGCCFITLLISGTATFFGMLAIKSDAIKIGVEIGETAAQSSNQAIRNVVLNDAQVLIRERAKNIEKILEDLLWCATAMSEQMTKMLQNPQDYTWRHVDFPNPANGDALVAQLKYLPGENTISPEELGLAGNLQDLQKLICEGHENISSTYITSESGFTIDVDRESAVKAPGEFNTYNSRERPYYRKAVAANKATLTDVYVDISNRGMVITAAAPYYNAAGAIAGVVGVDANAKEISKIISETTFGKTGYSFILNRKDGRVLFSAKAYEGTLSIDYDSNVENDPVLFNNEDENLAMAAKKMSKGWTGMDLVNLDGKSYYLIYTPIQGQDWSFGAVIEEDEVVLPAELSKKIIEDNTNSFVETLDSSITKVMALRLFTFIVMAVLILIVGRKVADKAIKPLATLTEGVKEFSSGNFDKKLDIHTNNEIEELAENFNAMTDELKEYMKNLTKVTSEKEKIATELNVAKYIQRGMLPNIFPPYPEIKDIDIYATMNAAKEVGGDFYDFYLLDENHLAITIADVSGKGIPASLFMVISKTVLKNFATFATNPDDYAAVVSCANNQLCQGNDEMMFVTVFFGVLEIDSGRFIFVNGGHNPPVIYHAKENSCEYLSVKKNFVLGGMEDVPYKQQEIKLERGDLIFAYTDGVNEAMNIDKEEYTSERLLNFMNSTDCRAELKTLLAAIKADVAKHVGAAEQSDDITMLALRRN